MKNIKLLFVFTTLSILLTGCETPGDSLKGGYEAYVEKQPEEDQQRLQNFTNNGQDLFPADMTQKINQVGDINYDDCQDQATRDTDDAPVVVLSTESSNSKDPMYATSLKNHEGPSKGCIPVENVSLKQARKVMASQNLTTQGASEKEERTLGAGLIRIQQLNGGPLRAGIWGGSSPYPFRFVDNQSQYSAQRADHIRINRKGHNHYGLSVAQHVHEYAHLVGNQGGYGAYKSFMGGAGRCQITNYAMRNRSEQFAEVFTAFVTEPNSLLSNTRTPRACKRAFEFFKQWFDEGDRVRECM